jgi:hypothetical protein
MIVSGKSGTFVSGQQIVNTTGFVSNQYIVSGAATTTFVLDRVANSQPSGVLNFAAWGGDVNLIVANASGIANGMFVNGIGFSSGQTVIAVNGNVVTLSAPPDSTPTGTVLFTSSVTGNVFAGGTTITSIDSYTGVVTISQATIGSIAAGRSIEANLPTGYYIRFTGPAAATKPITIISGFDQ